MQRTCVAWATSGLHETGRGDRWTWLARRLVQEELIRQSNDGIQRLHLRDSGRRFWMNPGRWILRPESGLGLTTVLHQVSFKSALVRPRFSSCHPYR